MKKLNVTVQCMAIYNSSIEVPDDMTLEEAIKYAKEHTDDIPLGQLEYVRDSDEIDEDNCDFDDDDADDADSDDDKPAYTWKDVVEINGNIYAEEFPISGKMDNENTYQIDDFLDSVAKKHGVDVDDVKTYMMDDIDFHADELPFGAESCGCYINGAAEWIHGIGDCIFRPAPKAVVSIKRNASKIDIRSLCYDLYKADWKDNHTDLNAELSLIRGYYQHLSEDKSYNTENYSLAQYTEDFGYEGKSYVRFVEFLQKEYLDEDYMTMLLIDHELRFLYYQDISNKKWRKKYE